MTTPPRVRIYRKKRSESVLGVQDDAGKRAAEAASAADRAVTPPEPAAPMPEPANSAPNAATSTLEERIAAVKAEGLTGRQLRLARRIAAMHGIDVDSDEAAVVILRDRNIDPFHRSSLSQIVARTGAGWEVRYLIGDAPHTLSDADLECAYARAILSLDGTSA